MTDLPIPLPEDEFSWSFVRSQGPGGQNVNKINSKAQLWVSVGSLIGLTERALARLRALAGSRLTNEDQIHLSAETQRSQEANRQEVFDRLREMIVTARAEPRKRRKTRPSKASRQRRLESKKRRSEVKSQRRTAGGDW